MPTKVCQKCFDTINDFARAREIWSETDLQLRNVMGGGDEASDGGVKAPDVVPEVATESINSFDENFPTTGDGVSSTFYETWTLQL